jgi:hypothetical protein
MNCESFIKEHDKTYQLGSKLNKWNEDVFFDCHYHGKAVPTNKNNSNICSGQVQMSYATRAFSIPLYVCEAHYSIMHYEKGDFEYEYDDFYDGNDNDEDKEK